MAHRLSGTSVVSLIFPYSMVESNIYLFPPYFNFIRQTLSANLFIFSLLILFIYFFFTFFECGCIVALPEAARQFSFFTLFFIFLEIQLKSRNLFDMSCTSLDLFSIGNSIKSFVVSKVEFVNGKTAVGGERHLKAFVLSIKFRAK